MTGEHVYVVALGASTPLGRDVWSSAAAVRAGLNGFTEHPYMIDTAGERMRVAAAPWLDPDLAGTFRVEALLLPAMPEDWVTARPGASPSRAEDTVCTERLAMVWSTWMEETDPTRFTFFCVP